MTAPPAEALRLGHDDPLHRIGRLAFVVGGVAVAVCVLGGLRDPGQLLRSYLAAYVFWLGPALGSVAILMIGHATGGAWSAVIRRPLESAAGTIPLLALLFLPVALGTGELYEWAHPEAVAHDPLLQHKQPYLNVPFFLVRAVVYFATWITIGHLLGRWSLEQDETTAPGPSRRLELLSRGGLVLMGLTMTFASIDWMMSLEPHWFSTIYGVLFMGGSVLTALAVAIVATATLVRREPFSRLITADHFHDLGKLLLAFVMLWAYFGLSQFLIIWSANLPEEVPWYIRRLEGGWEILAVGLLVFHFGFPFLVLLSRQVKRVPRNLALVAGAMLVVRFLDVFWLVAPAFPESPGLRVHLLDAGTLLGVGGLWVWAFVGQLTSRPLLPRRDPALWGES